MLVTRPIPMKPTTGITLETFESHSSIITMSLLSNVVTIPCTPPTPSNPPTPATQPLDGVDVGIAQVTGQVTDQGIDQDGYVSDLELPPPLINSRHDRLTELFGRALCLIWHCSSVPVKRPWHNFQLDDIWFVLRQTVGESNMLQDQVSSFLAASSPLWLDERLPFVYESGPAFLSGELILRRRNTNAPLPESDPESVKLAAESLIHSKFFRQFSCVKRAWSALLQPITKFVSCLDLVTSKHIDAPIPSTVQQQFVTDIFKASKAMMCEMSTAREIFKSYVQAACEDVPDNSDTAVLSATSPSGVAINTEILNRFVTVDGFAAVCASIKNYLTNVWEAIHVPRVAKLLKLLDQWLVRSPSLGACSYWVTDVECQLSLCHLFIQEIGHLVMVPPRPDVVAERSTSLLTPSSSSTSKRKALWVNLGKVDDEKRHKRAEVIID